jgi:uncharacterized membrane-anchored protein
MMKKVATVTLAFWVWKICATTLGETAGDLLSMTLGVGYPLATVLLLAAFALSLVFQLRSERFHPALYWFVILATSTAGTTMSDFIDRTLHMGYSSGALMLATILCLVLLAWRFTEGNLSVDDIRTRRAELFYWSAILVSNTLGTALGDFLADDSGLGFVGGAALIAAAIAAIALCAVFTRIDRVLLFWAAFVLTRPFGATFGDLLTKPHAAGGLDFGTIGSSAVLAAILAIGVLHATLQHRRRFATG